MPASPILMPKLGLTMQEGTVSTWNVAPGDEVKAGDVIFVVETDKIATEVEARGPGRIEEIRVGEGETVPVGAVVATWTGPAPGADAEVAESAPEAPQAAPSPPPAAPAPLAPRTAGDRVLATPYARRLAKEAGLDLAAISGSGPRGRIKAADVSLRLAQAPESSSEPMPRAAPAMAVFGAMIEADITALLDLQARLAAEVDAGFTLAELVGRALDRANSDMGTGLAVVLTDISATGAAWLLPPLSAGQDILISLGRPRPEYRPDSAGAPVLRQIVSLGMAGDPRRIGAEDGAALLGAIARLLENPLKILV